MSAVNPLISTTPLPTHMSDAWIQFIATDKLRNLGGEKKLISDMIIVDKNTGMIKKYVAAVDRTEKEINFVKLGPF